MTLTVEMLEKLKIELEQLPPVEDKKRVLKKTEAIQFLVDDVDNLRKKGYSYEQIAEILTKSNLAISAGTLKGYLSKARNVRPRKSKTKGTAGSGKATPARAKNIGQHNENSGNAGESATVGALARETAVSHSENNIAKVSVTDSVSAVDSTRMKPAVGEKKNSRVGVDARNKLSNQGSGTFQPKPDSDEL